MVAPSINPNIGSTAAPSPQPESNESKVNYLNKCVENISKKTLKHHTKAELLNKTIAAGSAILYIAATVAAVALTAIFSPASLPITALSMFFLLDPLQNFVSSRLSVAKDSLHASNVCKEMRRINDHQLSNKDDLKSILKRLKADTSTTDAKALKPVLSHYLYWHNLSKKLSNSSREKHEEQKTHKERYPNELEEITQIRLEHLALQEAALIAKSNAAFYLSVLRNPSLSLRQSDVMKYGVTVDTSNFHEDFVTLGRRAVADLFDDTSQKSLLAIKSPSGHRAEFDKAALMAATEDDLSNLILC